MHEPQGQELEVPCEPAPLDASGRGNILPSGGALLLPREFAAPLSLRRRQTAFPASTPVLTGSLTWKVT